MRGVQPRTQQGIRAAARLRPLSVALPTRFGATDDTNVGDAPHRAHHHAEAGAVHPRLALQEGDEGGHGDEEGGAAEAKEGGAEAVVDDEGAVAGGGQEQASHEDPQAHGDPPTLQGDTHQQGRGNTPEVHGERGPRRPGHGSSPKVCSR